MKSKSGIKRKAAAPSKKVKAKTKSSTRKEKLTKAPVSKKPKLDKPQKTDNESKNANNKLKKSPVQPEKLAKKNGKEVATIEKENPAKSLKKKMSNNLEKHQPQELLASNAPLKALDNKKQTSSSSSTPPKHFTFRVEDCQVIVTPQGRKTYYCDICQGEYKRIFSLKRHYLRSHLNYLYVSEQDMKNCGMVTPDKTAIDSNILAQQALTSPSASTQPKPAKVTVEFPRLFRCHLCGSLVDTKALLVAHLLEHKRPADDQTPNPALGSINSAGIDRYVCRRCQKAFSTRKLYRTHQKNVKCGRKPRQGPLNSNEPVSALVAVPVVGLTNSNPGTTTANPTKWRALAAGMDVEESLKLGSAASAFRYACTICLKMFVSYTNMCRHRRLAHGVLRRNPDICAKLIADPPAIPYECTELNPKSSEEIESDDSELLSYDKIEANVRENVEHFLDGIVPSSDLSLAETQEVQSKLMSWDNYTLLEPNGVKGRQRFLEGVFKLEIPIQIALQKGLDQLEEGPWVEEEGLGFHAALKLAPKPQLTTERKNLDKEEMGSKFSGEWTRSRRFLCCTCGQEFESLPAVEWHQQDEHRGIFCSYLMMEGEEIPLELVKQFGQVDDKMAAEVEATLERSKARENDDEQGKCTKCQEPVGQGGLLHTHMLKCAGDITWHLEQQQQSQSKKKKSAKKKRPQGRHGMRRHHSQTPVKMAFASATRSQQKWAKKHSFDMEGRVQITRRFLHFHEQKSREQIPPLDIIKKSSDIFGDVSSSAQTPISLSKDQKAALPGAEADSGPVQATSTSTLPPHNPTLTSLGIFTCPNCGKQYMYSFPYQKHRSKCPSKPLPSLKKPKKNAMPTLTPAMASSPSSRSHSSKEMDDHDPLPPLLQPEKPSSAASIPWSEDAQTEDALEVVKKVKKIPPKRNSKNKSPEVRSPAKTSTRMAVHLDHVPEEHGERLRTRSARRGIFYAGYDTELDPSFLAALSELQRHHVTEQRCPFCLKQYTYKSNFKKHLLEGCATLSGSAPKRSFPDLNVELPDTGSKINVKKAKVRSYGRNLNPKRILPQNSAEVLKVDGLNCVICFAEFAEEKEFLIHRLAHCVTAGSRDLKSQFRSEVGKQAMEEERWLEWGTERWAGLLQGLDKGNWDNLSKGVEDWDCVGLMEQILGLEKEQDLATKPRQDSLVANIVQPFIQEIMKKEIALWSQKIPTRVTSPKSTNPPVSTGLINTTQLVSEKLVIDEKSESCIEEDFSMDFDVEKATCPDEIALVSDINPDPDSAVNPDDKSDPCGAQVPSLKVLCVDKGAHQEAEDFLDASLSLSVVPPTQATPTLLNHESCANSFLCAECGNEFRDAETVFRHMNVDHPLNFQANIPLLGISSSLATPASPSQNELKKFNGRTDVQQLASGTQKTGLLCPLCGRGYKSFLARWKHMMRCGKTAKLNSGAYWDGSLIPTLAIQQTDLLTTSSPSQQLERLQAALRQAIGADCSIAVLGTEPNGELHVTVSTEDSVKEIEWNSLLD